MLSRAPYPEFGRIQEVDGSAKANYNALSLKLERRFYRGLSLLAGYTWARSIDTASAIRVHDFDTLFPQNSYNLAAERALSSFHVSHRFVSSFLYELPFGVGQPFLNKGGITDVLLGHWAFSSIITLQTGFPMTIAVGKDQSNIGAGFDRPNATGEAVDLPGNQRSTERYFNTGAFVLQPFGSFGNVGRNSVIGPGLIQWDFSLLKNFRIREDKSFQFRFEAFNAANHPNWYNPGNSLISSDFGKIRGTRTNMRELQFGLKFLF